MSGAAHGFAGDLKAFGLADLIQTIALGGRTGRLTIRGQKGRGELWFVGGGLIHAEVGPLSGDPAVFELLEWSEGAFSVEYGVETEKRSVEQEATYLVLEGLRRLDEKGKDRVRPPQPVPRKRRARRSAAGTVLILAVAVTAVAWIAGTGGASRGSLPDEGDEFGFDPTSVDAAERTESVAPPDPLPLGPEPPSPPPSGGTLPPRPKTPAEEDPAPVPPAPPTDEAIERFFADATEPEPVEVADPAPPAPPPATAILRVLGKSYVEDGGVRLLVDGEPVFVRSLERQRSGFSRAMRRIVAAGDERFESDVPVVAGSREILVEVDLGGETAIHRETARVDFAEGGVRTLRITAGRAVGHPVRVKLD